MLKVVAILAKYETYCYTNTFSIHNVIQVKALQRQMDAGNN